MIRHPAQEQLHRLTVKTLDQVFIMRAKEGLGCSQFEAEALTGVVNEVGPATVSGVQSGRWPSLTRRRRPAWTGTGAMRRSLHTIVCVAPTSVIAPTTATCCW